MSGGRHNAPHRIDVGGKTRFTLDQLKKELNDHFEKVFAEITEKLEAKLADLVVQGVKTCLDKLEADYPGGLQRASPHPVPGEPDSLEKLIEVWNVTKASVKVLNDQQLQWDETIATVKLLNEQRVLDQSYKSYIDDRFDGIKCTYNRRFDEIKCTYNRRFEEIERMHMTVEYSDHVIAKVVCKMKDIDIEAAKMRQALEDVKANEGR